MPRRRSPPLLRVPLRRPPEARPRTPARAPDPTGDPERR